jgi:hypothetical protein
MAGLVTDDVLDTFAVTGDVARGLRERFDGLIDRISFYTPYEVDPELLREVRESISDANRPI